MANEQKKASGAVTPVGEIRRDVDFVSRYANNVQVESNAFDLKLTFGILDQRSAMRDPNSPPSVEQHTAINLSWPEVKLVIFWMQVHLAGFEADNGKVKIANNALPPEIPANAHEQISDPRAREAARVGLEAVRKLRADFIASLKD
jgi:hypothetical protein